MILAHLVKHLDWCVECARLVKFRLVGRVILQVVHLAATDSAKGRIIQTTGLAPAFEGVHAGKCNPLGNADALLVIVLVVGELGKGFICTCGSNSIERCFDGSGIVGGSFSAIACLSIVLGNEELGFCYQRCLPYSFRIR